LETATTTVAELTQAHLTYLHEQQVLIKHLINNHFDKDPELKQQRDLLVSIPEIGSQTAAVLLSEIGGIEDAIGMLVCSKIHASQDRRLLQEIIDLLRVVVHWCSLGSGKFGENPRLCRNCDGDDTSSQNTAPRLSLD
jgi:hypothetical protein